MFVGDQLSEETGWIALIPFFLSSERVLLFIFNQLGNTSYRTITELKKR